MGDGAQDSGQDSPHLFGRLRRAHATTPISSLDQFHRVVGVSRGDSAPVEDVDQVLVTDLTEGVELAAQPGRLDGTNELQGKLEIAD